MSMFHNFKHSYLFFICHHMKNYFPKALLSNCFVKLLSHTIVFLCFFLKLIGFGKGTGIIFFDFTLIKICNNKRIQCKRIFKNMAKLIKSMMGDFFGFKLLLNCNEKRNLLNYALPKGNVDDRNHDIIHVLSKNSFEKLCADKGYIGQKFFNIF